MPIDQFRRECRDFAAHWIERAEASSSSGSASSATGTTRIRRWLTTAEAQIVREIGKFLVNGGLYKGAKPVLWSVVEQTALAEAEVEYHDHRSTTVWVRFPVSRAVAPALAGAAAVIWTTTPWTMPGNRAIAYSAELEYAVAPGRRGWPRTAARGAGETLVVADAADRGVCSAAPASRRTRSSTASPARRWPARSRAIRCTGRATISPCRCCAARFVERRHRHRASSTSRPGHGADDWELGQANGLPVPDTVGPDGRLSAACAALRRPCRSIGPDGKPGDANEAVIAAVEAAGGLLARGTLVHSYPHSWRSKAPLIFRNTPQWFICMEANGSAATRRLKAIDETRWVPPQGKNRIAAMIESRPDWCVSRQRAWGVPIPVFTQQARPASRCATRRSSSASPHAVEREGADAWFTRRSAAVSRQRLRRRRVGARSPTSSRCGSIPARPTPSCSSSGPS